MQLSNELLLRTPREQFRVAYYIMIERALINNTRNIIIILPRFQNSQQHKDMDPQTRFLG